jgi:putative SOS response-associated peptidase YedK
MCGRYTLVEEVNVLAKEFDLGEAGAFVRRYNISPTQEVPVIRLHDTEAPVSMAVIRDSESTATRSLDILKWGLIPHWAKDSKIAYSTINARAETVATQPTFRDAFRKRRCIVPASGFYEWQTAIVDGKEAKQPQYIRRADGKPLALAGLWDRWRGPDGTVIESFTIITTEANEFIRGYHDRMPVILRRVDYALWLNPASTPEDLLALLVPCDPHVLIATQVSRRVNSPKNDDPSCIQDVQDAE